MAGHPRWTRTAVTLLGVLFAVSTLFPIAAAVHAASNLPGWVGWLDALVAFVLTLCGVVVDRAAPPEIAPVDAVTVVRIYRQSSHALLVLLVIFFIIGHRIDWTVLIVGLAWRTWLFVYVLPAAVAVRRLTNGGRQPGNGIG